VDDISIPEINFHDDAESGDDGWNARGFIRMDNLLQQRFIVQAIELGASTRVVPLALDAANRATYTTNGLGRDLSRVVIAISGATPITWENAQYSFKAQ
jgi:hypothetical protein